MDSTVVVKSDCFASIWVERKYWAEKIAAAMAMAIKMMLHAISARPRSFDVPMLSKLGSVSTMSERELWGSNKQDFADMG